MQDRRHWREPRQSVASTPEQAAGLTAEIGAAFAEMESAEHIAGLERLRRTGERWARRDTRRKTVRLARRVRPRSSRRPAATRRTRSRRRLGASRRRARAPGSDDAAGEPAAAALARLARGGRA
jgi:hypothetical protein